MTGRNFTAKRRSIVIGIIGLEDIFWASLRGNRSRNAQDRIGTCGMLDRCAELAATLPPSGVFVLDHYRNNVAANRNREREPR